MILFGDKRFIETSFDNEAELENVVFNNYEYLFGPSSFILPKKSIQTTDGFSTIPDGFVIDLANKKWYIVEAELCQHSFWSHIAPQISKQITAARKDVSRSLIIEIVVNKYTENNEIKEIFEEEDIAEINVRSVLDEILQKEPIVGIPIDKIPDDLQEWARTLRSTVKLWTIKKFVDLEDQSKIIYEFPEEFRPDIDTEDLEDDEKNRTISSYDVSIKDLIDEGLITPGAIIEMSYSPKIGNQKAPKESKKLYKGTIEADGSIVVLNKKFSSPSYAALYCINDAGSPRKTVNGWTSWKTANGFTLFQIRAEYLKRKTDNSSSIL